MNLLGNDIIYLPHFKDSLNASFIRRVYTEEEKAYCHRFNEPLLRFASTFAAKEAVYKALKQWNTKISIPWKKIEIQRARIAGIPTVHLTGDMPEAVKFSLSISHDGDYVWALALCMIDEE
ncbi:MAG: 4'-phosphopantetheinyl transferase superfamily protein [Bacteroidetes bacterium]|nr:4'-phosphopantetheinyl transferase superfamily protein [Bacteroidota bacterium]